jgi:hypothetical protein
MGGESMKTKYKKIFKELKELRKMPFKFEKLHNEYINKCKRVI